MTEMSIKCEKFDDLITFLEKSEFLWKIFMKMWKICNEKKNSSHDERIVFGQLCMLHTYTVSFWPYTTPRGTVAITWKKYKRPFPSDGFLARSADTGNHLRTSLRFVSVSARGTCGGSGPETMCCNILRLLYITTLTVSRTQKGFTEKKN